jgi:hypothetical protein
MTNWPSRTAPFNNLPTEHARKAYDELDPGTALIHLNTAARILTEPAA